MYGLPPDFDPRLFLKRELDRVTFGANVIVLGFDNDLTVSVSGSLPFQSATGATQVNTPPVASTELVSLVGQSVHAVDLRSPKELVLVFERGALTLLDDSELYECYIISDRGREIIV